MGNSNFPLKRLKEITSKIGSGATPRGGKNAYKNSGIPLIRSMNVYDFSFMEDDLAFIDDEQAAELENVIVQKDDILLNITGASVARCCLAPLKFQPARVNQHVAIIRVHPNMADARFVLNCINSVQFKTRLLTLAQGGATREALTKTTIEDFEVLQPPLPVQQRIAGILSAYDELIENCQRRIKILERMARNLYREWFVNFRYPNHAKTPMVDSPLGKIPKGWDVKTVEEMVERIPLGKKYDTKTVSPNGAVPVFDQGKSGIIGYHDDEPGVVASEDNPIIVFANHTCYQRLIHFPFSAIQNVLPFVPNPQVHRNIYWLYWATNGLVVFNDYKGHWPEFASKTFIVPTADVCQKFGDFAAPLSHQILKLERTIENLRKTRDLLLPRLMSGQINVN